MKMTKMRTSKKKRVFTLLEIIVCLVIVTMLMGLVGVKTYQLIDLYRFRSSVHKMLSEINHWQLWAMTHNDDVHLKISQEKGEYFFQPETEAPYPLPSLLTKQKLYGVKRIKMDGKTLSSLDLDIYSTGRIEPTGILQYEPKDPISSDEALRLDLLYPKRIYSSEQKIGRNEEVLPHKPTSKIEKVVDPIEIQTHLYGKGSS